MSHEDAIEGRTKHQAPTPVTDDKFGDLRAALAAVAPAPWSAQRSEIRLEWWVHCDRFGPMLTTGYVGNNDARPMAEYLAVSRNTLPMLLSEHDRLAKKLEEAETILAEARKLADLWNKYNEPAGESLERVLDGKAL